MAWSVSGNIRGPQGPAGPSGPAGPQGPQGPTGATGPQGVDGPAGPAGATGPQGAVGPVGPAGLNWRGAWAAGTAYVTDDTVARNGATWFAPGNIAAGNDPNPSGDGRTAANGWALLAAEGAQGPVGATGAAGPQGPAGAQGPTGPQGTRGSQWYTGHGAPGTIAGSNAGDQYLDLDTGDVYTLA